MKKYLLTVFSLCLLSACSSGTTYVEGNQHTDQAQLSVIGKVHSYSNPFFTLKADSRWFVSSQEGPQMPAHITITNRFDKSIITVSASKYFRNMQETCTLSAKNLVNDHGSIVYGPVIENNTCVIKAKEGGMDMGIYLRVYNDNSFYSIHYEGNFKSIAPVIKRIEGDSRMSDIIKSIRH